jgi:4-hydroxy-2-oxoglutarate aldolase
MTRKSPRRDPAPRLDGVIVASVTPFDPVNGEVDLVALRSNVRSWLHTAIRGVLIGGSTGEGALLDTEELLTAVGAVREILPDDRLLVAGTGAESTRETIRGTKEAAEAGADLVLVQPPAFYRELMDAVALTEHYTKVADASPVPVLLYQPPLRVSTVELPTAVIVSLSAHPNVVGIKDSRGKLEILGEIVDKAAEGFQVLTGHAERVFGSLELGAVGAVLAAANFAPAECCGIGQAHAAGRLPEAGRLQEKLLPLGKDIVAARGIAGVKTAMDLVGLRGGPPRPPLRPLDPKGAHAVHAALEAAGIALTRPAAGNTLS